MSLGVEWGDYCAEVRRLFNWSEAEADNCVKRNYHILLPCDIEPEINMQNQFLSLYGLFNGKML